MLVSHAFTPVKPGVPRPPILDQSSRDVRMAMLEPAMPV